MDRAAARALEPTASIVGNPSDADLILFVDVRSRLQLDVIRSSIYRAWPQKCAVLCSVDQPEPLVPGLYAGLSIKSAGNPAFEGAPYIRVADNSNFDLVAGDRYEPVYLYSFVGKIDNSAGVRSRVLALADDRALLVNRSSGQKDGDMDYAQTLASSRFVLCPRGIGVSSWRFYETMRAGRVPVVISDAWVAPKGVDWTACLVRIPESQIGSIPEVLRRYEPSASAMGQKARSEWLRCFSYERLFGWVAERADAVLRHEARASRGGISMSTALAHGLRSLGPRELLSDLRGLLRQ